MRNNTKKPKKLKLAEPPTTKEENGAKKIAGNTAVDETGVIFTWDLQLLERAVIALEKIASPLVYKKTDKTERVDYDPVSKATKQV